MKNFKTPSFGKNIVWIKLGKNKIEKDTSYENLEIKNANLKEIKAGNVKVDYGMWVESNFSQSKLDKIILTDVKMFECNLSNCETYEGNWLRVEVNESKMTGFKINGSILEDVRFLNSNAQYMQMRFGKTKRVIFESCNLKGCDFQGTDLTDSMFINCDLSEAEFSGAILKGADLRGSNLEDIRISVSEIKGAIVNTSQALYLAGTMGIDIRD